MLHDQQNVSLINLYKKTIRVCLSIVYNGYEISHNLCQIVKAVMS